MVNEFQWDQVVEDLGPKLYRYFGARFSSSVADDLTQETLIRLVKKCRAGEYNYVRGPLISYAFGIARFVRMEQYKTGSIHFSPLSEGSEQVEDKTDLIGQFETFQELKLLRQEIANLPEPQQEILLLIINEDFTIEKVSTHLRLPSGTIKSHIHRAKKKLFDKLSNKLGEFYER